MAVASNADAGLWVAPYFVTGQILFLVAFALYLVTAILAIVVDFGAAEDACAEKSWVWLYVLLAVAIPTGLRRTGSRSEQRKLPFGSPNPCIKGAKSHMPLVLYV